MANDTQHDEYLPIPQPGELREQEKEAAMGSYFMMLVTLAVGLPLPIINLIAAFIYYYFIRSKGNFVKFHAYQSLISQIPISLLNAGVIVWVVTIVFSSAPFSSTFIGFVAIVFIANLVYLIVSIIAAVHSRQGKVYYFLFFGKMAYIHAFKNKPGNSGQQTETVNKPPV